MAFLHNFLLVSLTLSSFVAAIPLAQGNNQYASACRQLEERFSNRTSSTGSSEFVEGIAENWSETCLLEPYCLFEPSSTSEVASALQILEATNTKFAVRGGGHMPVPEAASISQGVLISTEKLNTMRLTNGSIAQLGPGLRWGTVYDWISQYDRGIVGGRYGPVGVPGLLLGGGISYFGSQYGWATNTVTNFEVVLANSSIVNANAQDNPDLFWALKGGSSNFGIVTRFDIKTFPVTSLYGGTTFYKPEAVDQYLDAVAAYSTPGGGSDDVLASFNPTLQVFPSNGSLTMFGLSSYLDADPDPAPFANFSQIPAEMSTNSVRPSFSAFSNETSLPSYGDRSSRWLFASTSLKALPESVYLSNRTFFETMSSMPALKDVEGLAVAATHQTITESWLRAARASGGDPIDLDPSNGGLIAFLIYAQWQDPADDDLVNEFAKNCIANTDGEAESEGLFYPFVYLNDAAKWQDPFSTYGGGDSLPRMKQIANTYDPKHVFQTLMPGGFKLEV